MTNFKVGQKVVCIKKDDFECTWSGKALHPLPKYKEIVTIKRFSDDFIGNLIFEEYEFSPNGHVNSFQPHSFRPIYEIDATKEILTNFQPSEDRVDLPIKELTIEP